MENKSVSSTDVEIEIDSYNLRENKKLIKWNNLIKEQLNIDNAIELIPDSERHNIKLKIRNSYSEFANAIRIIAKSYIPTKCISLDESSIDTNDSYIINANLKKNIEMLPLYQDSDIKTLTLDIENKTDSLIPVYSSDIKEYKHISSHNIEICQLNPGKYLKITMYTLKGISKDDAGKYSLLGPVRYKVVNVDLPDSFEKKNMNNSSVNTDYKDFDITLCTVGNVSYEYILNSIREILLEKLEQYKQIIIEYKNAEDETNFKTANATFTLNLGLLKIETKGFHVAVPAMIAKKCYQLDLNIPRVSSCPKRYDTYINKFLINHADKINLILKAIEKCKDDVQKIIV